MVVQALQQVARNISRIGQETGQFRQAAAQQNKSISSFIKDVSKMFSSQSRQQSAIDSSLNDIQYNSQQTNAKVDQSNDLLQESISLQSQMLSELRNVSSGISSLLNSITGGLGSGAGSGLGSMIGAGLAGAGVGAGLGYLASQGSNNIGSLGGAGRISSEEFKGKPGETTLASKDLSASEKAILETIAAGESSGKYNIINYVAGGGKPAYFDDYSQHPYKGKKGYTAAGRYQFLWTTWKEEVKALGENPDEFAFSPENQDRVAVSHAKRIYKQKTGRDLLQDIESQDPKTLQYISNTLRPTWHGIKGGKYLGGAYDSFKGGSNENKPEEKEPQAVPNQTPTSQNTPEAGGVDPTEVKGNAGAPVSKQNASYSGNINLQKYSMKPPSHVQGLDSDFSKRLGQFLADAEAAGHNIKIYSGYRDPEHQKRLWNNALKKYGSPEAARRWVAPPGRSRHNKGIAADLKYLSKGSQAWAHQNAGKYGLHFRMGHEPWHIEPTNAKGGTPSSVAGSTDSVNTDSSSASLTGSPGIPAMNNTLGGEIGNLMGMSGILGAFGSLASIGMGKIASLTGTPLSSLASIDISGGQTDQGSENNTPVNSSDQMPKTNFVPENNVTDNRADTLSTSNIQMASMPRNDTTQAAYASDPTGGDPKRNFGAAGEQMALNGTPDTTLPDWYQRFFGQIYYDGFASKIA